MVFDILILILAGILAGFINTLAGGGSVITLSLLLILGLPATVANGTNRLNVLFQTISSVVVFWRKKMFIHSKIPWLIIPAAIGSVGGAWTATGINTRHLEVAMVVIMAIMLLFMFVKPSLWLRENTSLLGKKIRWWQILMFLAVGWYAGFLHVGVGYLLLMALVLGVGFEIVKANAIKNLVVLFSAVVSLIIFMVSGQVQYFYGLLLSAGSVVGAYIASMMAVKKGGNFVRWVVVGSVILAVLKISGLVDFKEIFSTLLH
jgi:uncharacterized membrane protein YfcA